MIPLVIKVDLVMWTKNGAETLRPVLKRIGEVIPAAFVNKRLVVDDHSSDGTREIARSFGWNVVFNEGQGISDGANTALRQVESNYFVSFEQDLLLARDWWAKIPEHLSGKVSIASGVRLPNQPLVLKKIEEYSLERDELKSKQTNSFLYQKSLDNTIYKTDVVKSLGGFPKTALSAGVDTILVQRLYARNLEWKVDYSVRSSHLRKGLRDELAHYYWYGTCYNTLNQLIFNQRIELKHALVRAMFSPLRGLEIAVNKNAPLAIFVYPMFRIALLKGIRDGSKMSKQIRPRTPLELRVEIRK